MKSVISLVCLFCTGCGAGLLAGTKTVNSTQAIKYLEEEDRNITYTYVPPEVLDDPKMKNAFFIPSVAGKDVEFQTNYPDGTPHISLKTRRSAVVDSILGQIAGIDAEKFSHERYAIDFVRDEMAAWRQAIIPLIAARAGGVPVSQPGAGVDIQSLMGLLNDPQVMALISQYMSTSQPSK